MLDRAARSARPAARRPDRRDDRRRRQDRGRGRPRGLGGDRLRALLRARARPGGRSARVPDGAARRRGRGAALELPAVHPRGRRARRARRGQWRHPQARARGRAGRLASRPGALGRRDPQGGARRSCRVPTATWAAGSSPTRAWTPSSSPARSRRRAASCAWRPDLTLFAETSGKNAMIVTALADRDQAIRDLVRSAFGHDGQKCSAASLAICEAEVYEDEVFRRQLRDAAASLPVGDAWDPVEPHHPADPAAGRGAAAGADDARRGRGVAPRAAPARQPTSGSGRRGSSSAFAAAPSFTGRSASAPCSGSCGPRTWTRPSTSPTTRRSGSRAGSSRSTTARSTAGSSASRPATSTSIGPPPAPSSAGSPSAAGRPRRWGRAPRPADRTTCSSSRAGGK